MRPFLARACSGWPLPLLLFTTGCIVVPIPAGGPDHGTSHAKPAAASATPKLPPRIHAPTTVSVPRPARPLALAEARAYVLALVNRDRAAAGLEPLIEDPIAARAGQEHAEDMARAGYTAHWGTDGSTPEVRHTRAGGAAFAQENAACFADGKARELDPAARFDPAELEKVEAAFLNEVPPHDGHRRNLLTPWHTGFGVGLARVRGLAFPCMSQELTDHYGTVAPLAATARAGDRVRVAGTVSGVARFGAVGVARAELGAPRSAADLNGTGGYSVPKPHVTYFPAGFVTPAPVRVEGASFSIEVPLDRGPGLYEVSVFSELPEAPQLVVTGLRTVRVE